MTPGSGLKEVLPVHFSRRPHLQEALQNVHYLGLLSFQKDFRGPGLGAFVQVITQRFPLKV